MSAILGVVLNKVITQFLIGNFLKNSIEENYYLYSFARPK